MEFISLVNNIALLIALGVVNRLLLNKLIARPILVQLLSGVLFGVVTIIGMMNSLKVMPGLIFDGRSIILSLAGAFGGPVTALVSMLISASYRIYLGGPGALMGVLVITESALLGVLYFYLRKKYSFLSNSYSFLILGLLVHIIMVTLMFTLPGSMTFDVLPVIAPPVLIIYPIGTFLLALLFLGQEHHQKAIDEVRESEIRFRQLFEESQAVKMILEPITGKILDANKAAEAFYGWTKTEICQKTIFEINIWEKERILEEMERAQRQEKKQFILFHRIASGEVKTVEVFSGPVVVRGKQLLYSIIHDISDRRATEEALAKERKLMRTLIDNLPDALAVKDKDLKSLLFNGAEARWQERVHGLQGEMHLKEPWMHDFWEKSEEMERQTLETSLTQRQEMELKVRAGEKLWLQVSKIPLLYNENTISGLVSIVQDITPWRKALEDLQESEESYRGLFDAVPDAIYIQDVNGAFLDVNRASCRMYGYTRAEIVGRTPDFLGAASNDWEALHIHLQKAYKGELREFEFWGRRKNGEIFPKQVKLFKGQYFGEHVVIAIAQDISERRKIEQIIKESRRNLNVLLNVGEDLIVLLDKETKILVYNNSFREALNTTVDLSGMKFLEVVSPALYENRKEMLEHVMASRQKVSFEEKLDDRHWWNSFYPIIGTDGELERIAFYARDITNRVKLAELEGRLEVAKKAAQVKQQFLANMSHEMRTPMNGIIGVTDILMRTHLDEKQQGFVNTIKESSKSLLMLINDILDLSKIESGKMSLDIVRIDTDLLLHKMHLLFHYPVHYKGLEFEIIKEDAFPHFFMADEKRIIQVVTNFVGNAIKFTAKGFVKVYLSVEAQQEREFDLKIRVEDSGIGIHPDNQQKIFEEFAQTEASPVRVIEGTGLGLAISKKLVEMMDGQIGVWSEEGNGSIFWFTFHAVEADIIENVEEEMPEEREQLNLKVLVVEDKMINRQVAELMLHDLGCEVEMAENGLVGLEMIKAFHYDVVFMDVQMPVMDGVTAVKELRKMNIPLPVIIGLSAEAMEGDAEKYIAIGMDDYITKPLVLDALYQKLVFWKYKARKQKA